MSGRFLNDEQLPFCKGCGHTTINENLDKALQKLGYSPLDVVVVTDIGCHGIIDKNLKTHTVHGLHGRSVAVASGISAALGDQKKVIVMVGDGGATIGMQHLIDAAHRNFNMTVIIHNNMLYGMTGGQPSEFTPAGFKTLVNPDGLGKPHYDICSLMVVAGANYVSRIHGIGDLSGHLATAIAKHGFSLVEVMEICPSYGVKANPGMKLTKMVQDASLEIKVFADIDRKSYRLGVNGNKKSLFKDEDPKSRVFGHSLHNPVKIMLYGSAGGGIQLAAELLANAALRSGLEVSKKGSYPVTVGVGYSAAEVIISPDEIHFTGSDEPDHAIVLTNDGRDYGRDVLAAMNEGSIWHDAAISIPFQRVHTESFDFVGKMGMRNAAIYSVFYLISKSGIISLEALIDAYQANKISQKIEVGRFLDFESGNRDQSKDNS